MIGKIEKTIYISGYWLDTKEAFENCKCYVGATYEGEKDDDLDSGIFYWFEDQAEVDGYMESSPDFKDRDDSEFVITSITNETLQ